MKKTALRLVRENEPVSKHEQADGFDGIPTARLASLTSGWLMDCQVRQHSPTTISTRQFLLGKLHWFLVDQGFEFCGRSELRAFLAYVTNGHSDPNGRWGIPTLRKPLRPRTVHDYHGILKTFFDWLVTEEEIPQSPMRKIAAPIYRKDQIQPLTEEQVQALVQAARKTTHPRRDEAIVLLLLDSGMRASELCHLRMSDIDIDGLSARVLGKGNKERTVYFGRTTAKALWDYLREAQRDSEQAIFVGDRGLGAGQGLTRSGLLHLIRRIGKAAGLVSVRCSPHTLRHTAAVSLIRAGMPAFSVQMLLGHTDLSMTQNYVKLVSADVQKHHRHYSVVDRMRRKR